MREEGQKEKLANPISESRWEFRALETNTQRQCSSRRYVTSRHFSQRERDNENPITNYPLAQTSSRRWCRCCACRSVVYGNADTETDVLGVPSSSRRGLTRRRGIAADPTTAEERGSSSRYTMGFSISHEYVNPYFRIECTRDQKTNLVNRTSCSQPLFPFRRGIDLLARSK